MDTEVFPEYFKEFEKYTYWKCDGEKGR